MAQTSIEDVAEQCRRPVLRSTGSDARVSLLRCSKIRLPVDHMPTRLLSRKPSPLHACGDGANRLAMSETDLRYLKTSRGAFWRGLEVVVEDPL